MTAKRRIILTLASASEADFPSLFTQEQMTDLFWAHVQPDGSDILVTTTDGKELKRELVSIDKDAQTMELYVRTPEGTTQLYLYYDDQDGGRSNAPDTWPATFKMVHHMNDDPDTSHIADSTANGNDGTKSAANQPAESTGLFGGDKAQDFNSANPDKITLDSAVPIKYFSVLFKNDMTANQGNILDGRSGSNSFILHHRTTNYFTIYLDGSNRNIVASDTDEWHFIAGRYDGTNWYIYHGSEADALSLALTIPVVSDWTVDYLGDRGVGGYPFDGKISEVRLANTDPGSDWITATYNSLMNNAAFATGADDLDYYWGLKRPAITRTKYQITIQNMDGQTLQVVKDINKASLQRRTNEPAMVKVFCPVTTQISNILSDITGVNEICVLEDGTEIFTGPIKRGLLSDKGSQMIEITAHDYMYELKGEFITLYDADDTPTSHVTDILAYQIGSRPVLAGTIEPIQSLDITREKQNMYAALLDLQASIGGYMQVDHNRKFNWYNQLSPSTGQQIRPYKNLKAIDVDTDWYNFFNRLYIYGVGIDLTDAGYPTVYIEDTVSQEKYGRIRARYIDTSYQKPEELLAYAQRKIKSTSEPRITYSIDMINLAEINSFEKLELGSWVRLLNDAIGVDAEVQIVGQTLDLVSAQNIEVELNAVKSSIVDDTDYY